MNRSTRPAYKHELLYFPPFVLTDRLCVFPSQCIARHTEELYEVQGNTSTRAPQALSLVETNEASSRELLCATHDLAPPFHRPCGRRHKGISIKNSNQAEQDVVAQAVS